MSLDRQGHELLGRRHFPLHPQAATMSGTDTSYNFGDVIPIHCLLSHPPGAGQTLPRSQPAVAQLAEDPFVQSPTRLAPPSFVPLFDLWQPGSALSCVGYLQAKQPGRRSQETSPASLVAFSSSPSPQPSHRGLKDLTVRNPSAELLNLWARTWDLTSPKGDHSESIVWVPVEVVDLIADANGLAINVLIAALVSASFILLRD
jgi:hypothetical protein